MKKMIITFLVVWLALRIGPVLAQEVISSQGDTYTVASSSLEFTIGEPIIASYAANDLIITQGFHQVQIIKVTTGLNVPEPELLARVYPNPAGNFLKIEIENANQTQYQIHDLSGRLIKQASLSDALSTLDISILADGAFQLSLIDTKNNSINRYLIIKKK